MLVSSMGEAGAAVSEELAAAGAAGGEGFASALVAGMGGAVEALGAPIAESQVLLTSMQELGIGAEEAGALVVTSAVEMGVSLEAAASAAITADAEIVAASEAASESLLAEALAADSLSGAFKVLMSPEVLAAAAAVASIYVVEKAFEGEQEAIDKLNLQIAKSPALVGASSQAFQQQALTLEHLTGIQHEQIITGDSILARYNLTQDQIQKLIPLVLDFARVQGIDAEQAAQKVGLAFAGNARALKAVGIQFKATGDTSRDFATIYDGLRSKVQGTSEEFAKTHPLQMFETQLHTMADTVGKELAPDVKVLATAALDLGKVAIPVVTGAVHAAVEVMKPWIWSLQQVAKLSTVIEDTAKANADAGAAHLRTVALGLAGAAAAGTMTNTAIEETRQTFARLKADAPATYTELLKDSEAALSYQYKEGKLTGDEMVVMLERMGVSNKDAYAYVNQLNDGIAAQAQKSDALSVTLVSLEGDYRNLTDTQVKALDADLKVASAQVDAAQGYSQVAQAAEQAKTDQEAVATAQKTVASTSRDLANAKEALAAASAKASKGEADEKRGADQLAPSLDVLGLSTKHMTDATLASVDAELKLYEADLQAVGGITAVVGAAEQASASRQALSKAERAAKSAGQQAYDQAIADGKTAQQAASAAEIARKAALQGLQKAQLDAVNGQVSLTGAVLQYEQQLADSGVPFKRARAEFIAYAKQAGLSAHETKAILADLQHQVEETNAQQKRLDPTAANKVQRDAQKELTSAVTAHTDALHTLKSAQLQAVSSQMALVKATLDWEKKLVDNKESMAQAERSYQGFADKAGIAKGAGKDFIKTVNDEIDVVNKLNSVLGEPPPKDGGLRHIPGSPPIMPGHTTPHFASGGSFIARANPGGTDITVAEGGSDELVSVTPMPLGREPGSSDGAPSSVHITSGKLVITDDGAYIEGIATGVVDRRSRQLATAVRMGSS